MRGLVITSVLTMSHAGCTCAGEWNYSVSPDAVTLPPVESDVPIERISAVTEGMCIVRPGATRVECATAGTGGAWAAYDAGEPIRQIAPAMFGIGILSESALHVWTMYADASGEILHSGSFDEFWFANWPYCLVMDGMAECFDEEGDSEFNFPAEHVAGDRNSVRCGLFEGAVECYSVRTGGRVDLFSDGQFAAIAGGSNGICGLRANGDIECDGLAPPCGTHDWTDLSVDYMGCAVDTDGGTACWSPDTGQLGSGPSGMATVSTFAGSACGFHRADAGVTCWGNGLLDPIPP